MENIQNDDKLFSSTFRAGRRTYFFDIKKTRSDEFFLTITESKKFTDQSTGGVSFEKHRIFLYKEDFEKFANSLEECLDFVKKSNSAE